jgi:hypothetical protein
LHCDQPDEAGRFLRESAEYAAEIPETGWLEVIDGVGLQLKLFVHDLDGAERQLDRIAAGPRRTDWGSTFMESYRADIAFERGDFGAAVDYYAAALLRVPESSLDNVLFQVQGVSAALAGLERDEHAMELIAGVEHVYRERTGQSIALVHPMYEGVLEGARIRLDEETAEAAKSKAARMTYESLRARTLELASEFRR